MLLILTMCLLVSILILFNDNVSRCYCWCRWFMIWPCLLVSILILSSDKCFDVVADVDDVWFDHVSWCQCWYCPESIEEILLTFVLCKLAILKEISYWMIWMWNFQLQLSYWCDNWTFLTKICLWQVSQFAIYNCCGCHSKGLF